MSVFGSSGDPSDKPSFFHATPGYPFPDIEAVGDRLLDERYMRNQTHGSVLSDDGVEDLEYLVERAGPDMRSPD